MNTLKRWFTILVNPTYWHTLNPYCEEWDKKLNYLLDQYRFTAINKHTAHLGPVCIWIENHPYASMHPYTDYLSTDRAPKMRPSILTTIRAWKMLQQDSVKPRKVQPEEWLARQPWFF